MWTRDLKKTGNRALILLGQFLVLLIFIIYLDYVYLTNIRPDQLAKQNFRQTECLIMSKKLSTKGTIFHRYRADFLIHYRANGVQYNRWVSGNGLDMSHARNGSAQEQLLSTYADGVNYPCWYSPDNAEIALLVWRQNWVSTFTLIIPSIAGLFVFIFFLKNGLVLLGVIKGNRSKF